MLCEEYRKSLEFSEDFEEKISKYLSELYSWNKHTNLTSDDLNTFITKHICFSLNFSSFIRNFTTIFDFGSGNGVPGIPLAILFKKNRFFLVENKKRKVAFLEYISSYLKLENVQVIDSSYEECPREINNFCVIAKAFSDFKAMKEFFKKEITVFIPLPNEDKIPKYVKIISKRPDLTRSINFYELKIT